MADDNEGLLSPEQEEWIKELVSGLQRQREPPPATTTGQGSSSGVVSSFYSPSTAGNLRELKSTCI